MQFVQSFLDESTVLQKKAYKYLFIVMNKVHVSFYQEVQEILKKFENV